MKTSSRALAILLAILCSAAHAQTTAVGTLNGNLMASGAGSANYTISLRFPPGANDAEPDLDLLYTSSTTNGMAGVGWQLVGLKSMTRVSSNLQQDGYRGGVTYTPSDRFALNQQRLIAVSGTDGANNGQYRTEKESYAIVISHYDELGNPCGSGPCWFSMQARNGMLYELGRTSDSRILASGRKDVRVWAVNRITDLDGNSVVFTYTATPYAGTTNEGAYYPDTIRYTENTAAGLVSNRSVKFAYEARSDVVQTYTAGSVVTMRGRLKTITALVQGQSVKQYRFAYEAEPPSTTGKSRIRTISECASSDAVATCLSSTAALWQNSGATYSDLGTWQSTDFIAGWNPATNPRYVIDANGDGLADIVGFRNGVQVATSTGNNSFSAASTWTTDYGPGWTSATPRTLGDVTGDGLVDVVGFSFDRVIVSPSTGTRFDPSKWSSTPYPYFGQNHGYSASNNPRLLADVTGDGRADIVGFGDKTYVGISTGTSFLPPVVWNDSSFTGPSWFEATGSLRKLADVNGDGLADVIGFGTSGIVVGLSTGSSFDTSKWAQNATGYRNFNLDGGWQVAPNPRAMADVNGDGLADIVGFRNGVQVGISTGAGFTAPAQWNTAFSPESSPPYRSSDPRFVVDANGDGKADVVGFSFSGGLVALSTGTSFSTTSWKQSLPKFTGGNAQNPISVGDANGDGMADVISFGAVTGVDVKTVVVAVAAPPYPDLMNRVTDGIGDVYDITYAPITSRSVYSAAPLSGTTRSVATAIVNAPVAFDYSPVAATYPARVLVSPRLYVTASYTRRNDPARNALTYSDTTSLFYTTALYDVLAQRSLGFASMNKNEGVERTTSSFFNQTYPLEATTSLRQERCGTASPDPQCSPGKLLSAKSYVYESRKTAVGTTGNHPPAYAVDKKSETDTRYFYGAWDFATSSHYDYDDFSNETLDSYLGYVDQQGNDISPSDNLYTGSVYQNTVNPTGWILGYPLQKKQSLTAASARNFSTFTNGTDLTLSKNVYTTDGRMNVQSSASWDDQNNVYLTTAYGYDAFGNATSTTTPYNATTATTYDSTFKTYPDTRTLPANAQGLRMTLSFGYDAASGKQLAAADANGNVQVNVDDAFGRTIATQGPKPDIPGVISDPNLVSPSVTGSFPFRNATVVTLSQSAYQTDGAAGIYRQTTALQNWPTSAGRQTMWQKDYVDGRQRPYQTVQQSDSSSGNAVACTLRENDGRVKRQSLPAFTQLTTALCAHNTPPLLWIETSYNGYRQRSKVVSPAGADGKQSAVTQVQYAPGNVATTTEAAGDPYQYVRTATKRLFNGQPQTVTLAIVSDASATTSFAFDNLGRLRSVTDPRTRDNSSGVALSFGYDALNRRVSATSPDFGSVNARYSAGGQLASTSTPRGSSTFVFDALDRVLSQTFPGSMVIGYSYDASNVTNGKNELTSASVKLPNGTVQSSSVLGYDKYGAVSSQVLSLAGESSSYTTGFVNDPLGRALTTVFPDGSTYKRTYAFGTLRSQTIGAGSATYSNFTPGGSPRNVVFGNGMTMTGTYSPNEQPVTVRAAANGTTLLGFTYDWNHLFLLSSTTDTAGTYGSSTYSYASKRVTGVTGTAATASYGYDQSGNLTSANGVNYTYLAHRVMTGTFGGRIVFTAQYDGNGNMTARTQDGASYAFTYDGRNLMTAAQTGAETTSYVYDYLGTRIRRVAPDGTKTVYVTPGYSLKTVPGQQPVVTRLADDLPLGAPFAVTGNAPLYLLQDQIGSTILTVDAAGKAATKVFYQPYGQITSLTGPDDFGPKFQGKEWDASARLYYFGARYQDPRTGRFTIADNQLSLQTRQNTSNLYAFESNDPVNRIDTSGHMDAPAHALLNIADNAAESADAAQAAFDAAAQHMANFNILLGDMPQNLAPFMGNHAQQLVADFNAIELQIEAHVQGALDASNAAMEAEATAVMEAEAAAVMEAEAAAGMEAVAAAEIELLLPAATAAAQAAAAAAGEAEVAEQAAAGLLAAAQQIFDAFMALFAAAA